MKAAIIDKIKTLNTAISFAELMDIPGIAGDECLGWQCDDQLYVVWTGLSENATDCIRELIIGEIIMLELTSLLTYVLDGMTLTLPLPETDPLAKEIWFPHVINKGRQWEN